MQRQEKINEITQFLIEKPGYLKKSKYILLERLEDVTLEECIEAIKIAKSYNKPKCNNCNEDGCTCNKVENDERKDFIPDYKIEQPLNQHPDFKVTKAWQSSNGNWLYSVERKETELEATTEHIFNKAIITLKESIKPLKLSENNAKSNNRVLLVYTSDKHVGALTKSNSHYNNEYNYEVFLERMKSVFYDVDKMYNIYGKFKELVFVDLGDALDGFDSKTTRGGHSLPQNMDNKEQFNSYVSVHKTLFDNFINSQFANHYTFQFITNDNHSGDFSYFANSMLKTYLDLKYPQITKTNIQEKFIDYLKVENHCFIFTHGKDDEDMKFGFPMHLNDKTENYINKYIIDKNLSNYICHFIKGDLHKHNSEQSNFFRYKNVASIYGSSKWIHNNFGNTKPGYSLEILDLDDNSITEKNIVINES